MRGRKPLPENVHFMNGNPGKRARPAAIEPKTGVPQCPSHLLVGARLEWKRVAPLLDEAGLLTLVDRAMLAVYCQSYARWVEAETRIDALRQAGTEEIDIGRWTRASRNALDAMQRAITEFGMSPSSRMRAHAVPADQRSVPAIKTPSQSKAQRFFT